MKLCKYISSLSLSLMSPYSLSLCSWCTHHDINNLSVSMLRQFSIFQVILKRGDKREGKGRGGGERYTHVVHVISCITESSDNSSHCHQ